MAAALHKRLLLDIAELQTKPYRNIKLHVQDENVSMACLVLTVNFYGPMHLTVVFPPQYPLAPPLIHMDSQIKHPNIFGSYICASILNTTEGWTPAYTLKGIAIQLLSFFSSDKIDQVNGSGAVELDSYRKMHKSSNIRSHICHSCQFGHHKPSKITSLPGSGSLQGTVGHIIEIAKDNTVAPEIQPQGHASVGRNARRWRTKQKMAARAQHPTTYATSKEIVKRPINIQQANLPDEILLMICDNLEIENLTAFAGAWDKISIVMTRYDIIRTRELQCFCFKNDFKTAKLGVGVQVTRRGVSGFLESEFDLLSQDAFRNHGIRRSVQGLAFQHWLPLPISYGHWNRVKGDVSLSLSTISNSATIGGVQEIQVIYQFMNDVIVQLNQQAEATTFRLTYYPFNETTRSSLSHASEKAIESYFHLFHLLLCLATANSSIVGQANSMLRNFINGQTSKTDCPNLGHLLVACLISDVEITPAVTKAIIKETITRNVVWMLDTRGAGMADLSYLEPSAVSKYRLYQTFQASKTSYRLLMFLNLFRKTAVGGSRKPLVQLRDEAFDRHGAPPMGTAKGLAESIRLIREIKSFPEFLASMDIEIPSAAWFTQFLRTCMEESVKKGYSSMPINQGQALAIRQLKESIVEVRDGLQPLNVNIRSKSFFPNKPTRGQNSARNSNNNNNNRRWR